MAKRIYVGNLAFTTDENQLESLFAQYGQVSDALVVRDRFSGQSRGFGFVEMAEDSEAAKAIQALDGTEIDGRALRVSEARERDSAPRRGGGYEGGGSRGGGRSRY